MLTISQIDVDPRINKVARKLAKAGYDVDIICYQPEGIITILEEEVHPGYDMSESREKTNGKGRSGYFTSGFKRNAPRSYAEKLRLCSC